MVGNMGTGELGMSILNMSSNAFGVATMGIGSALMGILQGQDFKTIAKNTAFTTGGALLGSIIPGVGTLIGGVVGGLVGGLFGKDKGNSFTLSELVPQTSSGFDKQKGLTPTGFTLPRTNETANWYGPVADAYSAAVGELQGQFNKQLFAIADTIPKEMADQMLKSLAATDFAGMQSAASGGRWDIQNAESALKGVAEKYAKGLSGALGAAFGNAFASYLETNGPDDILGNDQVWSKLTSAAQQSIKALYEQAAAAFTGGDMESGAGIINQVSQAMSELASALAPITEIIETANLTDYEIELRNINKQFDAYSAQLQAAGVDMAKYTELETARGIALKKAAEQLVNERSPEIQSLWGQIAVLRGQTTEKELARAKDLSAAHASGYKHYATYLKILWDLEDAADAAAVSTAKLAAHLVVENKIAILRGETTQQIIDRHTEWTAAMESGDYKMANLLTTFYGLEDAATIANTSLQTLTSNVATAEGDLRIAYESEAASLKTLTDAVVSAENDLRTAYESEAAIFKSTIDQFTQFGDSLRKFKQSLILSDLSTLSPGEKYAEAKNQFEDISLRARLGDVDAIEHLQGSSQTFLDASRGYYASTAQYAADFAKVSAALDTTAAVSDRAVTNAQKELDTLTTQVSALITLDKSVFSVETAILALETASSAAAIAQTEFDLMTTQVSALITINESVLSVEDAISALLTAIAALASAPIAPTISDLAGGKFEQWVETPSGEDVWQSTAGATATLPEGNTFADALIHAKDGRTFTVGAASDYIDEMLAAGNPRAIYEQAYSAGISLASIDAMKGWDAGTSADWAKSQDLPVFGDGGAHTGGLRVVGERGWEVEATGPSRIWNQEQLGKALAGTSDEETKALLKEILVELRADKKQRGAVGMATLDKFDKVVDRLEKQTRTLDRRVA
jgi:hypothetical protein